jgi:hypothetical protein
MHARRYIELVAACLVLPFALRLCSAGWVMRVLHRTPRRWRATGARPERLAWAVDAVQSRLPWIWRRTCLRRATVLALLLRREGRDARVSIGVRRAPTGELEAHAWVTCDGIDPYLEPGDTTSFTPLLGGSRAAS